MYRPNFQIVRPISGLLIIDVQNDFISGSLSISRCPAKHNGAEVINYLIYVSIDTLF